MPLYSPTCLSLLGVSGSYASAPDSAPLSLTADADIRAYITPDFPGGVGGNTQRIVDKFTSGVSGYSLQLTSTNGRLQLQWCEGVTNRTATCTLDLTYPAHGMWVRITLDADDGAGGRDAKFWTSADRPSVTSPTWSLVDTVHVAATTSITDGSQVLGLGATSAGTAAFFPGKIFHVQIRNNILDDGSGIVFDCDFTTVVKTSGRTPTTLVEGSANAATVTVNGTNWDWFDGWAMINTGANFASSTDATLYTNGSWTPRPNKLYLAVVLASIGSGSAAAPTMSGNSMTWSQVVSSFSGLYGVVLYAALSGSAPAAGQTTVDFGAVTQDSCILFIIEVDGADISGSALAAIAQTTSPAVGGQASPYTKDFNTMPAAGSREFSAWAFAVSTAMTERSGWSELTDSSTATPTHRLETQWRFDTPELTAGVSGWASTVSLRGITAEIREASLSAGLRQAVVVPPPASQRAGSW